MTTGRTSFVAITPSFLFRCSAGLAVLVSACSFVNSFDDVKPLSEGTYRPGAPGIAPGDAGLDGEAPNPGGAIVVGGQVQSDSGTITSILTVVDPRSGRELGVREKMVVAAVRYDGLRDLWYIFESKSADFVPGPADEVVLHVRSLDFLTGVWTERSAIAVPPLQSYDSIGVLRERLVYIAHGTPPPSPTFKVVTLDTTDATKPTVLDQQSVNGTSRGMVATRSTTSAGGTASIVRNASGHVDCSDTGPCLEIIRIRLPNAGPPTIDAPKVMAQLPNAGSIPSYGSFASLDREVLVLPRLAADASSSVVLYEPRNQMIEGQPTSFTITDSLLRHAAVSECDRQVFVVGANNDLDLHAVPLPGDGGGIATKAATGHSGQAVYFEPTTKTVLAPFSQGPSFDLTAFSLKGTPIEPQLTRRSAPDWTPPPDVRPTLLGIREPLPIACR
jgi:hypothetical protein